MCVGAPAAPRPTMMATPPSLNGRLSGSTPRTNTPRKSHSELLAHIEFEREAERQLCRVESGARCARAWKDYVMGPLDALGTKIVVRHGFKMSAVTTTTPNAPVGGGWQSDWVAARNRALHGTPTPPRYSGHLPALRGRSPRNMRTGPADHWLDCDPTPVSTVTEEDLEYASSECDSVDDRCLTHELSTEEEAEEPMDDIIQQIKEMALWVSEPGTKRTIVVSSA